jgi:hypothetical protein
MRVATSVFRLAGSYGYKSDRALAQAMGLSAAQVSRVRAGKRGINNSFIAGAQRAFPDKTLDELFVIQPEGTEDARPSAESVA